MVQILGYLVVLIKIYMSVAVVVAACILDFSCGNMVVITLYCFVVTMPPLHSDMELITSLTSCLPGPKGFRPAPPLWALQC